MAVRPVPWVAADEFLALEEQAETKHWYFDGEIHAAQGGTPAHAFIAMNLLAALHGALKGRGCRVWGSGLLFEAGPKSLYTYPDVTVVRGPLALAEGRPNIITNPLFVAEVVSPETEASDRGIKASEYRKTPSIQQYALVSQASAAVEIHTRGADGVWRFWDVAGLEADCEFSALGCSVPMAAIYAGAWDE